MGNMFARLLYHFVLFCSAAILNLDGLNERLVRSGYGIWYLSSPGWVCLKASEW